MALTEAYARAHVEARNVLDRTGMSPEQIEAKWLQANKVIESAVDANLDLQVQRHKLCKVLLTVAPGHQGGHSGSGAAIADHFGIPFPLTMPSLEAKAVELGFDPNELWPWLAPMRAGKTS